MLRVLFVVKLLTLMNDLFKEKLDQFFSQFNIRRIYKKREVIVRADDDPPGVFILRRVMPGCIQFHLTAKN